jgi:1-acyl-sn-glycerol-3-phosphate acyltransferase
VTGDRAGTVDLLFTDDLRPPPRLLLSTLRPPVRAFARHRWAIEVEGAHHVPAHGPVIIAANHIGWLDGPLLALLPPRPVHVLTKHEMYAGLLGRFLRAVGQVPVERHTIDVEAVRRSVAVLRAGRAVGVFPEANRGDGTLTTAQPGAAYLALVTGAPVVPLAFLGTREAGGEAGSVPQRRTRIALRFGPPVDLGQQPWPRTRATVTEAGERLRLALLATIREAERATGLSLPGPIPRSKKASRD